MSVLYFLKQRIGFIRQFYENAAGPFEQTIRKIEVGDAPFEPPYSEDGEPPFMAEWIEAADSLQVLGYSCISMLAASLHLYFKEWERQCGVCAAPRFKAEFDRGWINGYRAYFEIVADAHFADSLSNLSLLEEIVLVRNRVQHPESITSNLTSHSKRDMRKLATVFFVEDGNALADLDSNERQWLTPPAVDVSRAKLMEALHEVDDFATWLESRLTNYRYGRNAIGGQ